MLEARASRWRRCFCRPKSRQVIKRTGASMLTVAIVLTATTSLTADALDGRLGDGALRVLVPDWIPQGSSMSILVTYVHDTAVSDRNALEVEVSDPLPEGWTGDALSCRVPLSATGTTRAAITGLKFQGVPQELRFESVVVRRLVDGREMGAWKVDFPLRVVRGSALEKGLASILVPAAVALLALPAFLYLLSRYAAARAWRTTAPATVPTSEDAWWSDES